MSSIAFRIEKNKFCLIKNAKIEDTFSIVGTPISSSIFHLYFDVWTKKASIIKYRSSRPAIKSF